MYSSLTVCVGKADGFLRRTAVKAGEHGNELCARHGALRTEVPVFITGQDPGAGERADRRCVPGAGRHVGEGTATAAVQLAGVADELRHFAAGQPCFRVEQAVAAAVDVCLVGQLRGANRRVFREDRAQTAEKTAKEDCLQ